MILKCGSGYTLKNVIEANKVIIENNLKVKGNTENW